MTVSFSYEEFLAFMIALGHEHQITREDFDNAIALDVLGRDPPSEDGFSLVSPSGSDGVFG